MNLEKTLESGKDRENLARERRERQNRWSDLFHRLEEDLPVEERSRILEEMEQLSKKLKE